MRRALRALALCVGCCALSAAARAEPTIWDMARDARARKSHHALVAVERMMARADQSEFDPELSKNFTLAAIAMLELAGAGELPEPRLRFLLGDLLVAVDREAEARVQLERALAEAPDSPLAARGWFNLAIASAKLGNAKREHEAYTRGLELEWDPDRRSNIFLNRAESSMVLGSLTAALSDYREAARLAQRPDLVALAYFGLGIVQERSGDLPSALASMQRASQIRMPPPYPPLALDQPAVFFVPTYDIYYYKALTAMAAARYATDAAEQKLAWEAAVSFWQTYLAQAEPSAPWLPNARRHLARSERELQLLAKRAPKIKPRAAKSGR